MKIDCIGLFVDNMPEMVAFYRDIVGFRTEWNGEPNADFESEGIHLIMYGRQDFEKMVSHSFNCPKGLNGTIEIAFTLTTFSDVDKEYERLVNLGAKSVFPPTTMPWGQRTCFVADPEGNLLEVGSFGNADFENLRNILFKNFAKINKEEFSERRLKKNFNLVVEDIIKEEMSQYR